MGKVRILRSDSDPPDAGPGEQLSVQKWFIVIVQGPCFSLWCCRSVQPQPSSGALIPTPEGTLPSDLQHGLMRPQVGTVSPYHLKQPPQDYECWIVGPETTLPTGLIAGNRNQRNKPDMPGLKRDSRLQDSTSLSELGQCIVLGVLPCRNTHDPGS